MDHELGDTPEGGDEDKETTGELNTDGALRELAEVVEALRADFRHSVQGYDHQRTLMDRLHSENEQLRRAELERSQDPMIRDLISLADTCLRNGRAWLQREAVTPSDVDRVLREVAYDVELILERQGVEAFKPEEGAKFDRRESRVVRSANTSDASRDGAVAEVLKPGYRIGNRILRYCEVVVWTFVVVPLTGAAETEPDDNCITSV
jgi:molecular chaperone GrpE (heat shock protein)